MYKCPECSSTYTIEDHESGEICCGKCGFVIYERMLSKKPEWVGPEKREKLERTGDPVTYAIHDKGLSTKIDYRNRDALNRPISPYEKSKFDRLRKWQTRFRVKDRREKNLSIALQQIAKLNDNLNLPKNVLDTAALRYRTLLETNGNKCKQMEYLVGVSVYLASRECGYTRRLSEVAKATKKVLNIQDEGLHEVKRKIGKYYRYFIEVLGLNAPIQDPKFYVSRLADKLKVYGKTEETAYKILKVAREARLVSGKDPASVAGAAYYTASVITGEERPITNKDKEVSTKNAEKQTKKNHTRGYIRNSRCYRSYGKE